MWITIIFKNNNNNMTWVMIWPGHLWGLLNTLTTISALSLKGIIKSQYFVTGASIDLSVVNRYTSLWLRLRTLDPASLQRHTHTIWTLQSFWLSHYQDNVKNIHVLTNPVHGEWKISLQINSSFYVTVSLSLKEVLLQPACFHYSYT